MNTRIRFDGVVTDLHGKPLSKKALTDLAKAKEYGIRSDWNSLRSLAIISRLSIRQLEEAFHEGMKSREK